MNNETSYPDQLQAALKLVITLNEPSRRRIISILEKEPATPTMMANEMYVPCDNVAQHLKILRDARIVTRHRSGIWIYYTLNKRRYNSLKMLIKHIHSFI